MLFRKPSLGSLLLILDVQSSIVRASLVQTKPVGKPRIVFSYSINIPHQRNMKSGKLIDATVRAIGEIHATALLHVRSRAEIDQFPSQIAAVHYVLASPWALSQAKTISVTFPHATVITEKLILEMIAAEREKIMPRTEGDSGPISVIEEQIFTVKINGYELTNWKSKTADRLEVAFAVTVAGSHTKALLGQACPLVSEKEIFFHSSLLMQYLGVRHILPEKSSYTLVHVHGELTDVAVVRQHSCTFFGSYPVGIYGVVRHIAKELKTDTYVADSSLMLYCQKSFDGGHHRRVTTAIDQAAEVWITAFKKLLTHADHTITLPAQAIVSARVHEDFFVHTLHKAFPHMETQILTLEQIKPHVHFDESTEPIRLSGVYALAIHSIIRSSAS